MLVMFIIFQLLGLHIPILPHRFLHNQMMSELIHVGGSMSKAKLGKY